MPSRNESRVAVTRSRSRSRPAEIVAPDRETPGHQREALDQADHQAVDEGRASQRPLWVAARSANTITHDQPISAAATPHRLRSGPSMTS